MVRGLARVTHGPLVLLSALTGGLLLALADVAARLVMAPHELPVKRLDELAAARTPNVAW